MTLIGANVFGISIRTPLVAGAVQMVVSYGLSLAMRSISKFTATISRW